MEKYHKSNEKKARSFTSFSNQAVSEVKNLCDELIP